MASIREAVSGIFRSKGQIEVDLTHTVVSTVRDKLSTLDAEIAAAEQHRKAAALDAVLSDDPAAGETLLDGMERLAARRQLLVDALADAERQEAEAAAAEQTERDRRAAEKQMETRRGQDRALAQHVSRWQGAHREVEKTSVALDKAKADLDAAKGAVTAVLPRGLPYDYRLASGHYLGQLWRADTLSRPLVAEVVEAVRQLGREQLGLVEPPPVPAPPPQPGAWEPDPDFDDETGPELPDYEYQLQRVRTGHVLPNAVKSYVVGADGMPREPTAAEFADQQTPGPRYEVIGRKRRLRAAPAEKPATRVENPPIVGLPAAEPASVDDAAEPVAVYYNPNEPDALAEMAAAGGNYAFRRPAAPQEARGAPDAAAVTGMMTWTN